MDRIEDAYNGLMGEAFMRKTRERLHWMCSKVDGVKILDIGCSQGTLARILGSLGKNILGVDINKEAIAFAEGKLAEMDASTRERVRFSSANFMDFKTEERFETIIIGEVLEHLAFPEAFVKKAHGHLVKNGVIVVTVPFGINDDPDHRQTFYWSWVNEIIAPYFDIKEVKFFGKWIGVVGVKRDKKVSCEKSVPFDVVKELEKAFYAIERPIVNDNKIRTDKMKAQQKTLDDTKASLSAAKCEAIKAVESETVQRTRADKAAADYAKLKTELTAEIEKQKEELSKASGEKTFAVESAAKQKTILEGEVARQKTALAAEQAKTKDLNSKVVALRNELTTLKNEAVELRANLDASDKVSAGQAEQITVLKAALQFATNRLQIDTNDTRLLEYSQEVRELRSALATKRDEAVERAEQLGRFSGQVDLLMAEKEFLSSRVSELSSALESEQNSVKAKSAELAAKDIAIKEVEAENERKAAAIQRMTDERTAFEQSLALLKRDVQSRDDELDKVHGEVCRLRHEAENVAEELLQEKESVARMVSDIEKLREEANVLRNAKNNLNVAFIKSQEEIRERNRQLEVLKQSMDDLQSECDVGKMQIEALDAAQKTMLEQEMLLKGVNEQIKAELADALSQLAKEKSRAATLLAELTKTSAQNDSFKKSMANVEAELAAQRKRADLERCAHKKFSAEAWNSNKRIALLEKTVKSKDDEIAKKKAANGLLAKQNKRADKLLAVEKRKYDKLAKAKLGRLTLAWWRIKDNVKASFSRKSANLDVSKPCVFEKTTGSAIESLRSRLNSIQAKNYQSISVFLKDVKVACIMDEFTWKSYSPEANMIQLAPETYREQLNEFQPELIFVESAWRGIDNKWTNCVHKIPAELQGILSWAKNNGVPTVFWNKEDPIHFDTFKNVASLFDYIFTYDFNCVQRYKQITGMDNAFFLPMAVQPLMFNPVEKYKRKDAFCFAGSYYKRYPERTRDLDGYIREFPKFKNVEIFDRQFGKDDPNYMMPPEYKPFIKGNLPYDEIDKAYKGYAISINLNSIKQANSIARRVFELLACNTVTVSNFSYGVVKGFGDLVVTSDSPDVIISKLKSYEAHEFGLEKFKLLGLRKVFSENTYRDRFAYICSKVFGSELLQAKPCVALISFVKNADEYARAREQFRSLGYENKIQVIVSSNVVGDGVFAGVQHALPEILKADYVGVLDVNDYYGKSYLDDLVNGFKYSDSDGVCKDSHFKMNGRGGISCKGGAAYKIVKELYLRRGLMTKKAFSEIVAGRACPDRRLSAAIRIPSMSVDRFNYCEGAYGISPEQASKISDLPNVNMGIGFGELQTIAEHLKFEVHDDNRDGKYLSAENMYKHLQNPDKNKVDCALENGNLRLTSSLGKEEYVYLNINKVYALEDVRDEDKIKLNFETSCSTSVMMRLAYYILDSKKQKIFSAIVPANSNVEIDIPPKACFVKFALRVQSAGVLDIGNLNFYHKPTPLPLCMDSNKVLCVTNHYPSYDNLYRNGFVHSRIKLYAQQGVGVTVFKFTGETQVEFSEFEGINVVGGNGDYLRFIVNSNKYSTIVVHFLDKFMWDVLKDLPKSTRIIVWCHGAEVLKYTRRLFNFEGGEIPEAVIRQSNERGAFWQDLLNNLPDNIHFVFVSKWMKDIVDEDYSVTIPKNHYSIINNPISTDTFRYVEKPIEQRYRILSIRPYATRKYANDLSVKCILELSKRSDFDKFEITMIGDGRLFDEVLEPLQKFSNVHILRTFLRQEEIYEYHKKNGLFLVPTRQDSQGVSKDEAMSSGLIPVTNDVTAIGEFVDNTCGVLSPAEDYVDMARQIGRIVDNPKLFQAMSRAAAERVRRQTASDIIIQKEIDLIKGE